MNLCTDGVRQLLVVLLAAIGTSCAGAEFFVTPNGQDTNCGSREEAFATIARARDAVRKELASGLDEDVTVFLGGGLYLWPRGDRPGESIVVPRLTELIRVAGRIDYDGPADRPVVGLVFRGLTFTQADRFAWERQKAGWGLQHDWEMFDRPTAMLRFRGAERCVVENCHFVNSGGAAVRLDLHCQRNRIHANHIEHVGGAGILLAGYGPGTKDVNRANQVTWNHIHHVGEILWHSAAIFAWQSGANRIANNLLHDTSYTAIVVSGRIDWRRDGKGECSEWGTRYLQTQRRFGVEQRSLAADPMFLDLAHGDLSLAPDSPAFGLGFEAIDLSNVGIPD